jgi:hypothetical protein
MGNFSKYKLLETPIDGIKGELDRAIRVLKEE